MRILMPQQTVPQAVAALLPKWANALIAFLALVGTAFACVSLSGNFTGNAQTSILLMLSYVAILMNGDLRVLYQFLVAAPSPLAAAVVPDAPAPAAAAPVVSGASLLQQPTPGSSMSQQNSGQVPPPSHGG